MVLRSTTVTMKFYRGSAAFTDFPGEYRRIPVPFPSKKAVFVVSDLPSRHVYTVVCSSRFKNIGTVCI